MITKTNTQNNTTEATYPENWKVNAEGPKNSIEKIGGIWRLEFNHELTLAIISGSISTEELVEIISAIIDTVAGLAEKVGSILNLVSVILKLGKDIFIKADQGNGILIRFGVWVVPTEVVNSIRNWN